jgi:hypothetical protein
MSTQYKSPKEVPTSALIARLKELADAVTKGRESVGREFTMRVPAECDRDADIVMSEAARRLAALESQAAQPKVPEGYVLAPIEPTASMLFYASTINRPHDLCRDIYRDMIAGHTHPEAILTQATKESDK